MTTPTAHQAALEIAAISIHVKALRQKRSRNFREWWELAEADRKEFRADAKVAIEAYLSALPVQSDYEKLLTELGAYPAEAIESARSFLNGAEIEPLDDGCIGIKWRTGGVVVEVEINHDGKVFAVTHDFASPEGETP